MRRKDKEITDKEVLNDILSRSRICRIGLVDNGTAYIVPVYYAFSEGSIFIHSAPHGRKMDLIRQNPKVSFEIEYSDRIIRDEIPCRWTSKFRSVMGEGTISIVTDSLQKQKGLDLIMRKYGAPKDLSYDGISLSEMVILVLSIDSITGKQAGMWEK